jgi:hypothetical protein
MGEAKRKRDLGILPNGMREEQRDQLMKRDWSKAPDRDRNNPNLMTSLELKEAKWSGFRVNKITSQLEIWILGDIRGEITDEMYSKNPNVIKEAVERLFQLKEVQIARPYEPE